jgi:hypothetical protein
MDGKYDKEEAVKRLLPQKLTDQYAFLTEKAIRSFLFSETYQMLLDPLTEVYSFSPQIVFEMWESEMITGNPRNSQYIRGEENE